LKRLVLIIFAGLSLSYQSLHAQTIDPAMLNALKSRAVTKGETTTVVSPLDQARQQEYLKRQSKLLQQRKKNISRTSRLEKDFRNRLQSHISQYGYSIFDNIPSGGSVMTGTVSDNYKLGIGDRLIITFQGSKPETYRVKVDLEGRVIIPDLKPIVVTGMSYGSFRSLLKKRVRQSIIGASVYVSLAEVRNISVFVVGEVGTPGVVHTTSLATPLEILMAAGGIKKTGSLRNISIYRDGKKTIFDIYALLSGKAAGFQTLNDGDRIVVPTIGATIAVDGEVVRPGIYELPAGVNSISFRAAMALAGGTLRPSGYEMSRIRLDANGRQDFIRISAGQDIYSGEAIIAHLVENAQTGRVELSGHVRTPGFRALSSAKTVRGLLGDPRNLAENPYLLFGLIERVEPKTKTRFLQAFSPEKLLSGGKDIPLRNSDRVIFLGRSDIAFLISDMVRNVIVTGKYLVAARLPDGRINPRYCKPLKDLSRIINDTQSNRFTTAARAVFIRKESENSKVGVARLGALSGGQNGQAAFINSMKNKDKTEKTANPFCPAIYNQVNNMLPFILEYIVSVDGAVRLPGVYPITHGTSVASLLAVSGGTSNDANITHIEIANLEDNAASGDIKMKWKYVNGNQVNLDTVRINPGAGIRVGSKFSNFESGAVLLSGELRQPGVYTIRKGEKLSELIKRAGGLTDQAYPYGAIFTRERVREIQREELEKTARHLQSAMVSASVKKNIKADSMAAVAQLTKNLVNAKIIGRVVIEANPVKLALNPSLDTVLEAGDALFIPKRPNFVVAMGDVLNPGALQFIPGKGVEEYINEVGGYTRSADEDRVYIVYPNGVARPVSLSSWGGDRDMTVPPGTAIVVPTDLSPYGSLSLVKEIGGIFQNLAVSAASIAVLARRR